MGSSLLSQPPSYFPITIYIGQNEMLTVLLHGGQPKFHNAFPNVIENCVKRT